jgi:hypothetical protein
MIDPRFASKHNITEEQEVLSQVTMLFGDVPMELIRAGKRSNQFYVENSGMSCFWSPRPSDLVCARVTICCYHPSDRFQPPQTD